MADPNWITSPVAAELEQVVAEYRDSGEVANHVTLARLLGCWSGLVEEVERGYADSVYEYANDLDSRKILDRVAASARQEARDTLLQWLRPWDERFEAATVRAAAPFHGRADSTHPHAASDWHWRIPRRLEGELKLDLEALGLV